MPETRCRAHVDHAVPPDRRRNSRSSTKPMSFDLEAWRTDKPSRRVTIARACLRLDHAGQRRDIRRQRHRRVTRSGVTAMLQRRDIWLDTQFGAVGTGARGWPSRAPSDSGALPATGYRTVRPSRRLPGSAGSSASAAWSPASCRLDGSRDAAVDAKVLAGDVRRVGRQQERDGLRDLLDVAVAARRESPARIASLTRPRVDEAGQHVVHADAVLRFLVRVELAEAAERGAQRRTRSGSAASGS